MQDVELTLRQDDIARVRSLVHRDATCNQRANQAASLRRVWISRDVTVGQSHVVAETEAVFDEVDPERRRLAARRTSDVAHDPKAVSMRFVDDGRHHAWRDAAVHFDRGNPLASPVTD